MSDGGYSELNVLLYSGGIDSLIAWEYLGRPLRIYFPLAHRYQQAELANIDRQNDALVDELGRFTDPLVIDHSFEALAQWEREDAKIPGRNFLLAMGAARYCAPGAAIWLVAQKHEMAVPDKTPEFFQKASEMLTRLFERPLSFDTPFSEWDKTEMVEWWISEGFDTQRLVDSWSCYRPAVSAEGGDWQECGNCPACMRKFIALELNGIDQADHYAQDPRTSEAAKRYVRRARSGRFPPQRAERTLTALVPGDDP